ncbi:biotin synthase [Methanobrevibacter olleyae]|uniref:Biotin synthase n=1 Tax=Methanobrevibacter olleyae TaxID=294671 RepID=A0A1I4IZN9_METOL|nr:biotin synthase BioB [Methanobrevibacter olleyae]SFL59795.1 biotin synthase [Methanobrevibacter olleyae]
MFDLAELKNKVLNNYKVTKEDALNLVDVPLDDLTNAANEIRQSFCGNIFDACSIINVKSGRCSENCKFCAQSNYYNTDIEIYPLLSEEELKEKTLTIYSAGFKRISYVASGRKVNEKEFNQLSDLIKELTESNDDIKICVSLGLLTKDQIARLNDVGVDRIHNNLESSRDYFKEICTTHSYDEKLDTINLIDNENLMICSGGIFGMGESFEDRIDLALELRDLGVKSIPINILNPIKGTPVENNEILSNDEACRLIGIFRFINPDAYIRMAGGRALLGDNGRKAFQSGANAAILGDMLTTDGVGLEEDLKLLGKLGFKISYSAER